jgi:hypothetical protein
VAHTDRATGHARRRLDFDYETHGGVEGGFDGGIGGVRSEADGSSSGDEGGGVEGGGVEGGFDGGIGGGGSGGVIALPAATVLGYLRGRGGRCGPSRRPPRCGELPRRLATQRHVACGRSKTCTHTACGQFAIPLTAPTMIAPEP